MSTRRFYEYHRYLQITIVHYKEYKSVHALGFVALVVRSVHRKRVKFKVHVVFPTIVVTTTISSPKHLFGPS